MSSHERTDGRREAFKNTGLRLSQSTRGIQNTKRSVRHLGAGTGSAQNLGSGGSGTARNLTNSGSGSGGSARNLASGGSSSGGSLGSDLAKIGRRSGKAPPTLSDDISIDDSVLSEAVQQQKQKRSSSSAGGGGRKSRSALDEDKDIPTSRGSRGAKPFNRKESFRLPPRRSTFNSSGKRGDGHDALASRSAHIRSSSSNRACSSSSSSSNTNGNDMDLSKSEHGTSSVGAPSGAHSGAHSGAAKGIRNLIGSMDPSTHSNTTISDPQSRTQPKLARSKTLDNSEASKGSRGSTSLHGIRNLLDHSMKDASLVDRSVDDNSIKDRNFKDGSINDKSADDDSPIENEDKKEFGANHGRSIQGIYKLLGSMRDVKKGLSSEEEQQQLKEKNSTPRPVRAPRQMQGGNKASLGRLNNRMGTSQNDDSSCSSSSDDEAPPVKKALDPSHLRQNPRMRAAREGSRRRLVASKLDEAPPLVKDAMEIPKIEHDDGDESDGDDANDFDTVATPKTVAEPQAPTKEAPPPPQRKIATRRPRNMMPKMGQQNINRQSAPAKIPATPMKSPGGFVIEMGPCDVAATPVGGKHAAVQNQMMTPVAAPVMPQNDTDSTVTPKTIPGTPAPIDLIAAPPPPPKRSADAAQRWKQRAKNRLPTMPGQTTPNNTNHTSVAGTGAPAISMLSPGGIVIEVKPAKQQQPPREPMTPSMAGELTPGSYTNSPYFKSVRNTPTTTSRRGQLAPNTPSMHSTMSELSDGSYPSVPSTPSVQSTSGDISELTPGTHFGRMTPRQTPRGGQIPGTPGFYNSTSGIISELTPGGYSVGLLGDDDYLQTPSASFHSKAGVISEMTPTRYGIILEESSVEDSLPVHAQGHIHAPSTPSLHSPSGVVSEMTPGAHSMPIGPLPIPDTPSVASTSSNMSELTPGTYGVGKGRILSTPSLHSPSGVVSEDSVGNMSNPSFHSESIASGLVSELTPATYGNTGLLDKKNSGSNSSSGQVPILG